MNTPKVTILMSTYNDGSYIDASIGSVLKQSYQNWEFIIIDDASDDNTSALLKKISFQDRRFRVITNTRRKDQITNLNEGLTLAKGDYIARIDSDDLWLDSKKLEKQVAYLDKNPHVVLIGCWGVRINERGNTLSDIKYPATDDTIRSYLLIENCFLHSGVLIVKENALAAGGYNNLYTHAADYEFWLRLGLSGALFNIPEKMVGYRFNSQGISATSYQEQIVNTLKVVRKYRHNYKYFVLSYIFWKMRMFLPRELREILSHWARECLFFFRRTLKH